jgi:hypothetical protein
LAGRQAGYAAPVRTRTWSGLVLFTALSALSGCAHAEGDARVDNASNASNASPEPSDPDCAASFQPSLDTASDLVRLTAACGAGLEAVTTVKIGSEQAEAQDAERFSFRGRAGRCYRVFAVGSPDVRDLDIAVVDAEGRLAAADLSDDRFPIAPPAGVLCLDRDQLFTIQIGVMAGSGSYLVQVWGS